MAQLIVMDGPGVGTTFELSQVNNIGSGSDCNICLQSNALKPKHARIKRQANDFFILPLPQGDVQVNGQPVNKERKLIHGDMVTLADILLLYGEEVGEQPTGAAAPVHNELPSSEFPAEDGESPTIKSRQKFFHTTEDALQSINQSKHASKNMEILLKVSNAIMSKLEVKDLLRHLLDIMFDHLPADRGTVLLRDPKANKLWPMASKCREGIQKQDKPMVSRTMIRMVLDTKESILTRDAMEDQRFQMGLSIAAQQMHAAICAPLVGKNEEVLGIIHLDSKRSDRIFTDDHLKIVTGIAMQSAMAIENALLVQQLGEKKRIEQELTIASNIQKELLPKELPEIQGIDFYGLMVPAKEVGGDYYDFVVSEDNSEIYFCIGDVSGKGVPAGLVMVMARCFFRPLILSCKNTKIILEELNKFLVEDTRKDMFMSMLAIRWDTVEQEFTWTGAGHEHLIVYRAKTKKCETIRAGGIVLGMLKKAEKFFKEHVLKVEKGDVMLLYTDGVTECINPKGQMLELQRLVMLIEKYGHLSAKEICTNLLSDLKRFMSNAPQHDDITIVAIKR